jgi:hypothetical protein
VPSMGAEPFKLLVTLVEPDRAWSRGSGMARRNAQLAGAGPVRPGAAER